MTGTDQPLRIGILSFAHPHVAGYARALRAHDAQVFGTDTGHYDPGTVRGRDLAAQIEVEYLDDVDAVLARHPDAVVVTAENAAHADLARRAIDSGAAVLCEKPLTTDIGSAVQLVAAAEAAGVLLMTAYPVRFAPSFRRLVASVRGGELGEIVAISGSNNGKIPLAERSWFTDRDRAGGGALIDHVVHCADLIDELLGEQAQDVFASVNRVLHADRGVTVETGGVVSISYPSGVIATIDCSWSQPDTAATWGGLTLEVHGTAGSIRIDPFADHLGGFDADGAVWAPYGVDLDQLLIDEFIAAIRAGRRPMPDGHAGLRSLAIVDAAQRSLNEGRPVSLAALPNARATRQK